MRRKDREVTDFNSIIEVVEGCMVCRLGLVDDGSAYILPLNFGYTAENGELTLYFHSYLQSGRKLDILKKNPEVCFEMDSNGGLVESDNPCTFGYDYKSVMGYGKVEFIEELEERKAALNHIMRHQAGREFDFTPAMANCVCIYKVAARELTCKVRKA